MSVRIKLTEGARCYPKLKWTLLYNHQHPDNLKIVLFKVVFTDNGSKDLKLKDEILRVKKKKDLEIYIVLTPDYEGRPNDESLRVKRSHISF